MKQFVQLREVRLLDIESGSSPFERWLDSVQDANARLRILVGVRRLADPAYANFKSVGGGVFEVRIFYGPGYRIYFAPNGDEIVVLIAGGTKKDQGQAIYEAKALWKKFKNAPETHRRLFRVR